MRHYNFCAYVLTYTYHDDHSCHAHKLSLRPPSGERQQRFDFMSLLLIFIIVSILMYFLLYCNKNNGAHSFQPTVILR